MSAPQDAPARPLAEPWHEMRPVNPNRCPQCGGHSYAWGDPLPGQTRPAPGEMDMREREMRTCSSCGHSWRQGAAR